MKALIAHAGGELSTLEYAEVPTSTEGLLP
jgi:hypothetical protein